MKQHTQLCWDCQNCYADKCCWIATGSPVEGWDAEWVDEVVTNRGYIRAATYAIKGCPNFVPDAVAEPAKAGRPSGTGKITKLLDTLEKLAEQQKKLEIKIKGRITNG